MLNQELTERILKLEDRVDKLVELVKLQQKRLQRNDELNTWLWYRGHKSQYSTTDGPGHGGDIEGWTYYIKFDGTKY